MPAGGRPPRETATATTASFGWWQSGRYGTQAGPSRCPSATAGSGRVPRAARRAGSSVRDPCARGARRARPAARAAAHALCRARGGHSSAALAALVAPDHPPGAQGRGERHALWGVRELRARSRAPGNVWGQTADHLAGVQHAVQTSRRACERFPVLAAGNARCHCPGACATLPKFRVAPRPAIGSFRRLRDAPARNGQGRAGSASATVYASWESVPRMVVGARAKPVPIPARFGLALPTSHNRFLSQACEKWVARPGQIARTGVRLCSPAQ